VCSPGRMRKKNAMRIMLATAKLSADGAAFAKDRTCWITWIGTGFTQVGGVSFFR
jgi:hypothetical protein